MPRSAGNYYHRILLGTILPFLKTRRVHRGYADRDYSTTVPEGTFVISVNDVHAERVVLIAPRLLRAELANVLSVSVRRGRISAENATLCLEAISGLNLVFADIDVLAVTRFSLLAGISVYDANYVVVAERHRCVLYTADQRMIRATRPYSDRVRPISDYGV